MKTPTLGSSPISAGGIAGGASGTGTGRITLGDAVNEVEEIARIVGANCIIWIKMDKKITGSSEALTVEKIYYFKVGRIPMKNE